MVALVGLSGFHGRLLAIRDSCFDSDAILHVTVSLMSPKGRTTGVPCCLYACWCGIVLAASLLH